jgi:hypothetical protein
MKLFLFFCALAYGAPVLDRNASYPVKAEEKAAAPDFRALNDVWVDSHAETSGTADTRTVQRIRLQPLEPKSEGERTGVEYQRFDLFSRISLPGMAKPFESRQDLGTYLLGNPFQVRWKDGEVAGIDGLDGFRARLSSQVKDPVAKFSLLQVFTEDMLKKSVPGLLQPSFCLKSLSGKTPGAKWQDSHGQGEVRAVYECSFEGWAEARGKRVAVIGFRMQKRKTPVVQPNGQRQLVETEGSGKITWEPRSQETLVFTEMNVVVEPPPDEVSRLERAKRPVPRTATRTKSWSHHYPPSQPGDGSPASR